MAELADPNDLSGVVDGLITGLITTIVDKQNASDGYGGQVVDRVTLCTCMVAHQVVIWIPNVGGLTNYKDAQAVPFSTTSGPVSLLVSKRMTKLVLTQLKKQPERLHD